MSDVINFKWNNGTKIIDKNINKIIFGLTLLGKHNREISVEIKNQSLFDLDSWNYEIFVIKKLNGTTI